MEERIKRKIQDCAKDVLSAKEAYDDALHAALETSDKFKEDPLFYGHLLSSQIQTMRVTHAGYRSQYRTLSQFVHGLGDEYVEYMNNYFIIMGGMNGQTCIQDEWNKYIDSNN